MGNSSVVAYGYTKEQCVASMAAQIEYKYGVDLYYEADDEGRRHYYVECDGQRRYVAFTRVPRGRKPIRAHLRDLSLIY